MRGVSLTSDVCRIVFGVRREEAYPDRAESQPSKHRKHCFPIPFARGRIRRLRIRSGADNVEPLIVSRFSEPDNGAVRLAINPRHHLDLLFPLCTVVLVDADGVHPEDPSKAPTPQPQQRLMEVCRNGQVGAVYQDGVGLVQASPYIGQSLILTGFSARTIIHPACGLVAVAAVAACQGRARGQPMNSKGRDSQCRELRAAPHCELSFGWLGRKLKPHSCHSLMPANTMVLPRITFMYQVAVILLDTQPSHSQLG